MEKTIKIDNKDVRLKMTGGVLYRYKTQFGREFIADLMKLQSFTNSGKKEKVKGTDGKYHFKSVYDYAKLDLELAYDLTWALAKTADQNIPEPQEWLDSFNTFPITEILPQVMELVNSNFKLDQNSKN